MSFEAVSRRAERAAPSGRFGRGRGKEAGMRDNPKTSERRSGPSSNREKDPDDWTIGDEPMIGAQASYLKTLCEEAEKSSTPI
jgi:hypothetical protein